MKRPFRDIDALERGDKVLNYQIESLIGRGGMGVVYSALGPDRERVALKFMRSALLEDHAFRQRFLREAEVSRLVSHPNVVRVLATGEHDGRPWFASEFLSGGSLADRITSGPMDLKPAIKVCLEVAGALDALHQVGLFHRDLKAANVLFDAADAAHVSDFGLSVVGPVDPLTAPGQAIGSLDYMAPEQIRGEDSTGLMDIYALGCIVYECIAGSPPFAERTGMKLLWAHLQDSPTDPCADRDDLPTELGPAILRALEKEPAERPQTAGDYARQILRASRVGM
jgi:serine/threonine-protein kinase